MSDQILQLPAGDLRLPSFVIDRAGRSVDLTGPVWRLNSSIHAAVIDWNRFPKTSIALLAAAPKYVIHLIKTASTWHCRASFNQIVLFATFVAEHESLHGASREIDRSVLSEYRSFLAAKGYEYEFHRLRFFVLWTVDDGHDAFSPEVAFEISRMRIPGNRKGTAVLSEDPEEGPLTEEEVVALLSALRSSRAGFILTLQQRAALWLCFALGRNPANYCLLQEQDLVTTKADGAEAIVYDLMVPRIKKRSGREREEFKRQKITAEIADLLKQLIVENDGKRTIPEGTPKWLFRRETPHRHSMNSDDGEFSYAMYASEFTVMIGAAVAKLEIKSPNTGKPLKVTTRRLRYTYATRLVDEGISHRALAEALDHTDLQNILVYFNARSNIVRRIDAAIALRVAPLAQAFAGQLIDSEAEALRGKDPASRIFRENTVVGKLEGIGSCGSFSLCGLGPPVACYTCQKFQPWRGAPHEALLNDLLADRERKLEAGMDPKMVKLLDPTIYAVAEVVRRIKQGAGAAQAPA